MKPNKFIVCGASRAGKSLLAARLQKQLKISWILGDALVSSLQDAFPEVGITHHNAEKLETYIKYILWHYAYAGIGYVFDSTHLRPHNIINMRSKIGPIPTVFLGYAEADPQEKLHQTRQNDPQKDWWTCELSDEKLLEHIERQIQYSQECREECAKLAIPYIETSQNFMANIEDALSQIISR